jgi:hypothetical protein
VSGEQSVLPSGSNGSTAGLRELNIDAVGLPVELACHAADDWVRHGRP